MQKRTIIVVSEHVSNWGAERSTCSLAAYIKEMGHRVVIVIPKKGKILELLDEYELEYQICFFKGWIYYGRRNILKWLAILIINTFQLFKLVFLFKKRGINPDVVYSNTLIHEFGIRLADYYSIPHVQHIRENVDTFGMKFYRGYKRAMKKIAMSSSKVICTCGAIEKRYRADIPQSILTHEYNGVPICEYIEKRNVNQGILQTVFVGRIDEDKRPLDVCMAMKYMIDNGYKDIHLDFYGTGTQEKDVEAFIMNNNLNEYISLKGFCPNKDIDYDRYDVGFLSSTFEAFARTTLEYMMHGLAVIGSNSGGTIEQIVDKGTGLLYETHNPFDMYRKIAFLYENREIVLKYGQEGRKRAENYFSQERYVKSVSAHILNSIKV